VEDLAKCTFHKNLDADGQCCVCQEYFCDSCLYEEQLLTFCGEHLSSFQNKKWVALKSIISTSETPEAGVELYELKGRLWSERKILCYIDTKYELSEVKDIIESHVTLFVDGDYYSQLRSENV
jgi:hypothetical protein